MFIFVWIFDILIFLLLAKAVIAPREFSAHPILIRINRMLEPGLRHIRRFTGSFVRMRFDIAPVAAMVIVVLIRGIFFTLFMRYTLRVGMYVSFINFFDLVLKVFVFSIICLLIFPPYSMNILIMFVQRISRPVHNLVRRHRLPPAGHVAVGVIIVVLIHFVFTAIFTTLLLSGSGQNMVRDASGFAVRSLVQAVSIYRTFTLFIIFGALISWVSPDPRNILVQFLWGLMDPILRPFRRYIPPLGGLDVSPIFAILAISLLGSFFVRMLTPFAVQLAL